METTDWVKRLQEAGDKIEKKGINECNLGDIFPRYAEFWGKFILPNRSDTDPSKLREGFDPQLEDIFNTHYSIFFQLTTTLCQIKDINNPLLDIATPIYHLGAAVDLTERLFVNVLKERGLLIITKLDRDQFTEKALKYYDDSYESSLEEFSVNYRPVQFTLYNVTNLFQENLTESGNFRDISGKVRQYRNMSI